MLYSQATTATVHMFTCSHVHMFTCSRALRLASSIAVLHCTRKHTHCLS
jgi:hypothetical protein